MTKPDWPRLWGIKNYSSMVKNNFKVCKNTSRLAHEMFEVKWFQISNWITVKLTHMSEWESAMETCLKTTGSPEGDIACCTPKYSPCSLHKTLSPQTETLCQQVRYYEHLHSTQKLQWRSHIQIVALLFENQRVNRHKL